LQQTSIMSNDNFSYDPSCRPNNLVLCISHDQLGVAAIDLHEKKIKQIEYRPFDLYNSDTFSDLSKEWIVDTNSINRLRVVFLLNDWCWTPTSLTSQREQALEWIKSFWPDRIGHAWIADSTGTADATAWVRVPVHLLDQLKKISSDLTFTHASFFNPRPPSSTCQLSIVRIGSTCCFSVWNEGHFLYGQPHTIESTEDLTFVLSLLREKYSLQLDQMELDLSGQWPLDSEWMDLLQKHFPTIQGRDIHWTGIEAGLPPHWFTPLEDIFTCV
jgi:hypothetical protein